MTTTPYRPLDTFERDQANTIGLQIERGVLMSLGAHGFAIGRSNAGNPAFSFAAKIIPTGQRAARTMTVVIQLTPADTYDIKVTYPKRGKKFSDPEVHYETTGVYNDQLSRVLLALDKEG